MMRITAIEKHKGRSYNLFVDGEYAGSYDLDVIAMAGLRRGDVCDEKLLAQLRLDSERRRAKERALYLLGHCDHSRRQLVEKLCKSVSAEIAEETADKMEELGFLDDWKYAQKLARKLMQEKVRSGSRVLWEMQHKGVSREMAQRAMELVGVDPVEQIAQLVRRKYAGRLEDADDRRRVVAALARRGFGYDDIQSAIRMILHEENL